ncbi:MAG: helix-turn-helix domain-containing protein [Micromonosporaceae bacterium]|nr:helix-turn-helix domain-containing protein [Micromonosporaceae bacterium]
MTTTVHSPTAGRRRLRNALRRARDLAHLTQEQVAAGMEWSLSKVIRIETGAVGISISDLRQLLQLYRIDDPEKVTELVELARVGRRRPWWTQYKDTVPGEYLSFVGLEDESTAVRCFCPAGMPGLLQTEEFAHAVVNASWWATWGDDPRSAPPTQSEMAARVEVRMTRQREVLRRPVPPEITAVLDEAVLWRQVGGRQVLRRQLLHLVGLASKPHITIQVLPFTANVSLLLSPFIILEFADPADTDVVYVEGSQEQTIFDGAEVATHRRVFERVRAASLSEEDSLELIARVAGGLS